MCTTPQELCVFIYHCAAFGSPSCVLPSATAICVIPIEAFLTGLLTSSSKAVRPSEKGASISCDSERRSAKNCKEDAKPSGPGRVTMAREEQGRRKVESLPPFPAGLMQSADNVCFIHSSPLFSNHLLRDISKKGRRGRD